jgi:hypothetical protein
MATKKQNQPSGSNQQTPPSLQENSEKQNQPSGSENFFYGNQDTERKFKLPNDWSKSVCVWQCKVEPLNGGMVEVPNTHQLQTYDPATYDKMVNGDPKGNIPPFFAESKMKVVVLHDPRVQE